MARGSALIEEHAGKQSVARLDELAQIFIHATNVSAPLIPAVLELTGLRWKEGSGTWV